MINPDMQRAHAEVPAITPDNPGGKLKMFNPKVGRYQVTVTIGPNYATKRIEASESMMDFMRVIGPEQGKLIQDLVAKESDWQGAEQIAARLAKALPPNLLSPDREDMSPQAQAMLQGLQQQVQQSQLQIQQMTKEMADRQKDRDVMTHQIDQTYLAKHEKTESDMILALKEMQKDAQEFRINTQKDTQEFFTKMQIEQEKLNQKREADFNSKVGRELAELSKALKTSQKQEDLPASTPGPSSKE